MSEGKNKGKNEVRERVEAGLRGLCQWAAVVRLEHIPGDVLRKAMLMVCDDLSAVVAAREEPEVVKVHDRMLAGSGAPEATVFRGGRPLADRYAAAVANGVAADWTELDGGYRKAVCHAALCTLPALLAEAEAEGLSLAEMLRCAVVSYEFTTRVARCWTFSTPLVHHPHATFAALGSAASVGLARKLDARLLMDAVTSAATMVSPGPFNHAVQGALVRNVWTGLGAWNGMRCVDFAACGIGGLPGSLHDVYTIALNGSPAPEALTEGLGDDWAVRSGYHKMHACCQYSHSTVEAALSVMREGRLTPGQIPLRKVVVETHPHGMSLDNYHPATTLAAKFSIPQIVAATLTYGHAGADAFTAESLTLPAIAKLREKVELRPYLPEMPPPNDRPARVTLEMEDGSTLGGECLSARGGPDRPFSEEEVLDKVRGLTAQVYPAFGKTAAELLGLPARRMEQPWGEIVGLLTGGGVG